VIVVPIRYGYFDVFRFWMPVWTRLKPIRYIQQQIQIGKNNYRVDKYSVIAHSFGTYAISQVLEETKDLVLEKLVLCGCIIPNSHPWEHLNGRIKHKVINDYGTRDIWPFWARKLSWGYGETGRYGFGRSDVEDRAHDHGHSDYLLEAAFRNRSIRQIGLGRKSTKAFDAHRVHRKASTEKPSSSILNRYGYRSIPTGAMILTTRKPESLR
jgi:pimeloyl-ACP methyl ester carboxylesterase